jgi:preprotein translocase subunit YajC
MANADGRMPGWFLPGQILLIVGIFYFLIIRPQGQARKKHEDLLAGLKQGDDVMTAGGLLGKVKKVEEKDGIWRVTLETGTSTVIVERSRITRVGDQTAPQA